MQLFTFSSWWVASRRGNQVGHLGIEWLNNMISMPVWPVEEDTAFGASMARTKSRQSGRAAHNPTPIPTYNPHTIPFCV